MQTSTMHRMQQEGRGAGGGGVPTKEANCALQSVAQHRAPHPDVRLGCLAFSEGWDGHQRQLRHLEGGWSTMPSVCDASCTHDAMGQLVRTWRLERHAFSVYT
jgi:hypothetical protein